MKLLGLFLIILSLQIIYGGKHFRCIKTPDDYKLHIDKAQNKGAKQIPGYITDKAWYFNNGGYMQWGTQDFGSDSISIAYWARYDAFSQAHQRIIDLGNGAEKQNIVIYQANKANHLSIYYHDHKNKVQYSQYNGELQVNEWNHYTLTIASSGIYKLYRNGVKIDEKQVAAVYKGKRTNTYIGKSNWGHDGYFQGVIEDLRIYERVLDINEIQCLADICSTSCFARCDKKSNVCQAKPKEMTDSYSDTCPIPNDAYLNQAKSNNKGTKDIQGPFSSKASYFNKSSYRQFPQTIFGGALTYTFWTRIDSINIWQRFYDFGNGAGIYNHLGALRGKTLQTRFEHFQNDKSQQLDTKGNQSLKLNQWYHVAILIQDDGTIHEYIDGTKQNIKQTGVHGQSSRHIARKFLYLGKSNWKSDQLFHGAIDNFQLYRRNLDVEEIKCMSKRCHTKCTNGAAVCAASGQFCPKKHCAYVYSECNYKGDEERVCGKNPMVLMTTIQSVKIEQGYELTLYNDKNFQSQKVIYKSDQACLKSIKWK